MAKGVEKTVNFAEAIEKLNTSLTHLDKTLEKASKSMDGFGKSMGGLVNDANNFKDATNGIGKSVDSTTKGLNNMNKSLKAISFNSVASSARKIMGTLERFTQPFVDYIEDLNLLKVAFGDTSEEAYKLTKNIAAVTGYDQASLVRGLGTFRNLTSTLGMTNQQADLLAMNLEKMSLDISSLYNVDLDRAAYALQGVLTGQPRTIKTLTGANVTQQALQNELAAMGIDRKVRSLNSAEKAIVSYLALERQLINSNGDMARTIDQPAQMLKIFRDQLSAAARSIGTLFLPAIKLIIPYLTALLMVFNAIVKVLASLFGIDADSFWNDMSSGVKNTGGGFDNLGNSIDKTTKAAKKAQLGLRGFDKLNVIKTPTDGSANGGIGGLGIGSDILKGLKEYDLQLDKIRTKATEIAESIMKWLGFTKDANGEWKFTHLTLGTVIGALIGAGGLLWGILKIVGVLKNVSNLWKGLTGLGKAKDVGQALGDISSAGKQAKSFKLPSVKTVLKGLAEFALIVGGLVALVTVIGAFMKIPGVEEATTKGIDMLKKVFLGLLIISVPLAAAAVGIAVMGNIGVSTFAKGLADFAIVVGGLTVLITAIGAFTSIPYVKGFIQTGIETMKQVFDGLGKIMLPYGIFATLLVGTGFASSVILPGLLGFAAIMGGLEILMIAIGAVASISYVKEFVATGIDLMVSIFNGLGRMVGAIVGGFLDQATAGLPKMGKHLSEFMENMAPFFAATESVNKDSMQAVEYLAGAILKLTAADILDGLFGWLKGGSSIVRFGKDLAEFAPYFKEYSKAISGINAKVVKSSASAALSLAEFANALPRSGGIWQELAGGKDLEKFAKILPDLGKNLKKYSDNVTGLKGDVVENSANAALSLTKLNDNLPKSGGVWQAFVGEKNLGLFAKDLPTFGKNLKKYGDNVANLNPDVVTNSANAAKSIVEFSRLIPNRGGLVSLFTGDNSISAFGFELENFGWNFNRYYNWINGISIDKLNNVTESIKKLVDVAGKIKDRGVKSSIKDFANELGKSTDGFNKFFSIRTAKSIGSEFGIEVGNAISASLRKVTYPKINLTGIGGSILGTYSIKAYSDGGFVNTGELFVAKEKGPELVGQIGNKTAVANSDQIVSAISQGVTNAILSTGGMNNRPVVIKADSDTNGLMSFIRFKQQEDDMQYGN